MDPMPRSVEDTPVTRALVSAVRHHANPDPRAGRVIASRVGPELVAAAIGHGVSHRVLDWLHDVDPGHAAVTGLQAIGKSAAIGDLKVRGGLRHTLTALQAVNVPVLTFKGPVLAALAGGRAVRAYGDLDLLVRASDFARAIEAIDAMGATVMPGGGWKHFFETQHAQVPVLLPSGVTLDLHWHLMSRPERRRWLTIEPFDVLLGRAERLPTIDPASDVLVLEHLDMVLHTASHAAWSGGDRLGWLVDVDSAVRRAIEQGAEWEDLVARSTLWGVGAMVGDQLMRAKEIIGSKVPECVIQSLRRGRVAALYRVAERMSPVRAVPRSRSLLRFAHVDAGDSLVATANVVAGRMRDAALRRARGQPTENQPLPVPPDDGEWRDPYLEFARHGGHVPGQTLGTDRRG